MFFHRFQLVIRISQPSTVCSTIPVNTLCRKKAKSQDKWVNQAHNTGSEHLWEVMCCVTCLSFDFAQCFSPLFFWIKPQKAIKILKLRSLTASCFKHVAKQTGGQERSRNLHKLQCLTPQIKFPKTPCLWNRQQTFLKETNVTNRRPIHLDILFF
jgi:hypothetical protein